MAETTDPKLILSIDLKKYRLRIYKQTLKVLDFPPYIQLLFSSKCNAIVILRCKKQSANGKEIPVVFDKSDSSGTFCIYCKELIIRIHNEFGGLDKKELYHLTGFPVSEKLGVCFLLSTLTEEPHV